MLKRVIQYNTTIVRVRVHVKVGTEGHVPVDVVFVRHRLYGGLDVTPLDDSKP